MERQACIRYKLCAHSMSLTYIRYGNVKLHEQPTNFHARYVENIKKLPPTCMTIFPLKH